MQRTICTVAYSDGRVETYPVTPKVELTFERAYKKPVVSRTFEGDNGTWLTYALAWEAMRHHKSKTEPATVVPATDNWIDTLEAVSVDKEDIVPLAMGGSAPPSSSPSSSEPIPSA